LFGVYVDTQAFLSSLVDVDGVEFASLDLMQHSLAGDSEDLDGVRESYPALRDGGGDPVTDSLVDPDPPRSAGSELLAGEEQLPGQDRRARLFRDMAKLGR
jgi:hypothetical protein